MLIITDSLGLPRSSNGQLVSYEKTWVTLLRENYQVHQVSIGGATISELLTQVDYHYLFYPDIVIVQAGIVDCAPRAFTKNERIVLNSIWGIRRLFMKISKKYGKQIRNFRQKCYTPPDQFEAVIKQINNIFSTVPVYFLGIIPALESYETAVKGVKNKIDLYNSIIKSNANYISLENISEEHIMPDFHHLSEKGNEYVYQLILKQIN